jgi:phospholipid N-methyltransferase
MKIVEFTKTAVKDYRRVGAVVPSSKYIARRIAREIKGKEIIIEYGAGDGVISKEILKTAPRDVKILAFETNQRLFKELEKIKDSRLNPLNNDIRQAKECLKKLGIEKGVEAVVSGIPFSMIKRLEREKIIKNTKLLLKPGGVFILYQVTPLVLPILKKHFKEVQIKFELKNLPPYFIMIAKNF